MFTKTIFAAALVLGTSLTFVANASARPAQAGWQGGELREARLLRHDPAGQSSLCPPGYSIQQCFYGG